TQPRPQISRRSPKAEPPGLRLRPVLEKALGLAQRARGFCPACARRPVGFAALALEAAACRNARGRHTINLYLRKPGSASGKHPMARYDLGGHTCCATIAKCRGPGTR